MVIFVETSRVILLIASPVRGKHSLLPEFDTCAQGDLTVNLRIGRARCVNYRYEHLGSSRCPGAGRAFGGPGQPLRRGSWPGVDLWLLSVSRRWTQLSLVWPGVLGALRSVAE